MSKRVLIVDDEESIRGALEQLLSYEKFKTFSAGEGSAALDIAASERIDIVLLDIKMPGMDGLQVLGKLKELQPELPVIIISGHGTISTAVEATMLAIMETITRVAPTNARVLIMGENGTGKELVARKLHELSKRTGEPFVEVNCAAIPEDLIESELFGHEKGSFTGAISQRIGKFELADGGTLFLDEVGDMSLSAQAKVLRVLQESAFERVGGTETKHVDVRVLAATNKSLLEEAARTRFREDLYYRLNVVPIRIPPLRERKSDIKILADYFLREVASELGRSPKRLASDALDALMEYSWPGNVRELRNLIERLCILTLTDLIRREDLPMLALVREVDARKDPFGLKTYQEFKDFMEKDYLVKKLRENNGNVSRTARQLDMQRSNLYKKLEKYGIDFRSDAGGDDNQS
jgi:two-component system nitrogen regulation response regulator NtrX